MVRSKLSAGLENLLVQLVPLAILDREESSEVHLQLAHVACAALVAAWHGNVHHDVAVPSGGRVLEAILNPVDDDLLLVMQRFDLF